MDVKIKRLSEKAVIPKFAKPGDAGADITATSYVYDKETNRHVYGTDLSFEIPKGYVGLIFPRSSICKKNLRLTNSVGVIDSSFRGEVKAYFEDYGMNVAIDASGNLCPGDNTNIYKVGERIMQMIILPYPQVEFIEVAELSGTKRGTGGFGSSGK